MCATLQALEHHLSMNTAVRQARTLASCALAWTLMTATACTEPSQTINIRGHQLSVRVYGPPEGYPVVLSSGDGGWIHLAPHVGEVLAAKGFHVVGFDARAYLASFTSGKATLRSSDEPADYRVLTTFASGQSGKKPVLIGVSEGAGLSVLAATDPETRGTIAGVIGLGLPDLNELGWRWKDFLIYLTHQAPNEPTFSTAAIVRNVAPAPLAVIHSTQDEFVPVADVQRILLNAQEPKKLWIVKASDHRFSDNLTEFDRTLFEALEWVKQNAPP